MVVVSLALICSGLEILFFIHLFNLNKDYTLGALPDAILPVNPDLDRTLGIIWFMGPVVGSNTLKKINKENVLQLTKYAFLNSCSN